MKKIAIVTPCFNEEENIGPFFDRLSKVLARHDQYAFQLILVNDGSSDGTFPAIEKLSKQQKWVKGINFTRNFGKEAALTAGLNHAGGDAVIFIDADLQHPPEVIDDFIHAWEHGAEVVLGRRISRDTDTKAYRFLASIFYRLHNRISDVKLPENVGDFRLIDRKVADHLRSMPENCRFMKGMFAWVGYAPQFVEYEVEERFGGKSSFNKWRSWNLALEGITSFSTAPLRVWTYIGTGVLLVGLLYSALIIVRALMHGIQTPGYVTLLTAMVIFGGVQLIGLGILGEYIGRIYMEAKRRPPYLIKEMVQQETPPVAHLDGHSPYGKEQDAR